MAELTLHTLSLRYSSWSIRPWLALAAAGADFETVQVDLPDLGRQNEEQGAALIDAARDQLSSRRSKGSVTGLFPVLEVDGCAIHESLAICEWVAESYPDAGLWPSDALARARARAICCEMVSGFQHLRSTMSCHVFARVPGFVPNARTRVDLDRVFEIFRTSLERSGGPFLFGQFGIADCFYFPVLTRLRTYCIPLDEESERYARAVEAHPAVGAWRRRAESAPATPIYDELIRSLGGDPEAGRV